MFWLSQNRFGNLCIKGNVQIHLILFLHFGTRNTFKPYTTNWREITLFLTTFYWKIERESNLNTEFKEACVRVRKSWLLRSCLLPTLSSFTFLIYSIATVRTCKQRAWRKKKKIEAKTALESNNVTFNPKGQLLSHTRHSLQYFCWFDFHSWAGTSPPQPHGVMPLHRAWEMWAVAACLGMLGRWGYLTVLANDLSPSFSFPSERSIALDLGLLCSSALSGGAEGVKIHSPLLLLVQLLLLGWWQCCLPGWKAPFNSALPVGTGFCHHLCRMKPRDPGAAEEEGKDTPRCWQLQILAPCGFISLITLSGRRICCGRENLHSLWQHRFLQSLP